MFSKLTFLTLVFVLSLALAVPASANPGKPNLDRKSVV